MPKLLFEDASRCLKMRVTQSAQKKQRCFFDLLKNLNWSVFKVYRYTRYLFEDCYAVYSNRRVLLYCTVV